MNEPQSVVQAVRVPHEAINLSATEPARAVVARNDSSGQDRVEPFVPPPAARS